ncbi:aminotransferase class III-fold pyridoxal phosphate-dependent enzyme [Candidatus Thorarchaeota archaeon]|nr:MAG: aminotransferase class III-fold pyridoxal phosphate-dependent enzyme [Candidatus Thorarchaeota archaeon]
MQSKDSERPPFNEKAAMTIAETLYDLKGTVYELPSERDRNFRLSTDTGEEYILKISAASEKMENLEFQNAVLNHLNDVRELLRFPRVVQSKSGCEIDTWEDTHGTRYFIRLLVYLPGVVLAKINPHSPDLLNSLGQSIGNLTIGLKNFSHPAAHSKFYWDMKNASEVISQYSASIEDLEKRDIIDYFLGLFETSVLPYFKNLRCSIIHNDTNDYNIVVNRPHDENRSFGLLDFGDMIFSYTVFEIAVTIAYAILDKASPLTTAQQILRGYHSVSPLTENEIELLFPLICTRLAMSVSISAYQQAQEPDNEYLRISEVSAWNMLSKLRAIHPRFATYMFRNACGKEPCLNSSTIVKWLVENQDKFGHVLELPLTNESCCVVDLHVGSVSIPNPTHLEDPQKLDDVFNHVINNSKAMVGIGRYNEARLIYLSSQYTSPDNNYEETRTIHLATDLIVKPGTSVHCPIAGRIHSFKDNDHPSDNGPSLIIEHKIPEQNLKFYTLYGHLSKKSMVDVEVGALIDVGQQIGEVGDISENGGWPSHLHFQLIVDLLDKKGDFFGLAPPSQREVWKSICPDSNLILGIPHDIFPESELSKSKILTMREKYLSKSLSISYKSPLKIVRGFMQYLYDDEGQEYLDIRNNVPQVGHCNPIVVDALSRQAAVLNTNSRYLSHLLVNYADRLCAKFPEPLSVCFFVNSGSEANELALRLARTHTKQRDIIAIEGAYHGNTERLIDISSYKHDGPGGEGAPAHVHKVRMPDGYRGVFKSSDSSAGEKYAQDVCEAIQNIEKRNRKIMAFICEPLMGCGGQIIFPQGYLEASFKHVRKAGGVCIVDEVQTGFGRMGTHFWGFETQGVIPDIVTLGKPIGNGHPIGAVITTPEIAKSFHTGMEFFSTTGGNSVSCAVGLAVLDVIQNLQLQENSLKVGNYLLDRLNELKTRHPIIGDVRGIGLFIGVELVRDPISLEPASEETKYVVERMKDFKILVSLDGAQNNVLKIKPPLVFTTQDANRLVDTLDKILYEDPVCKQTM